MTDGGTWNLATLPRNLDTVRSAGRVLRGVHESGASITNLAGDIGNLQIEAHYQSTLERLERFRRRLNIPAGLLEKAAASGAPAASESKPSHTRPTPEQFLIAEGGGQVTLIDWEWATMAPPEWDVSLASWQLANLLGEQAAGAFLEGYGAAVSAGAPAVVDRLSLGDDHARRRRNSGRPALRSGSAGQIDGRRGRLPLADPAPALRQDGGWIAKSHDVGHSRLSLLES